MNNTIYYDSPASDDERRQQLYDGQLFVFSPRKSILDFVDFARSMVEDSSAISIPGRRKTRCRSKATPMSSAS